MDRIAVLEKENTSLKENLFSISSELNAQVLENRGVLDRLKQLDEKDKKVNCIYLIYHIIQFFVSPSLPSSLLLFIRLRCSSFRTS